MPTAGLSANRVNSSADGRLVESQRAAEVDGARHGQQSAFFGRAGCACGRSAGASSRGEYGPLSETVSATILA